LKLSKKSFSKIIIKKWDESVEKPSDFAPSSHILIVFKPIVGDFYEQKVFLQSQWAIPRSLNFNSVEKGRR